MLSFKRVKTFTNNNDKNIIFFQKYHFDLT